MKIIDRDITEDERKYIYDDFADIEIGLGIPQTERVRYSYVARENGDVVGYASGINSNKWFVLTDMCTKWEYRRQGLGLKLLLFLEEQVKAAGVRYMYTWTMGRNNAQYYKSLGYECFTVLENFFDVEGMHHLGYRKDF